MKSDRRKVPMRNTSKLALALLVSFAGVAMAQDNSGGKPAPDKTDTSTVAKKTVSLYRPLEIGHMRPADSRGVGVLQPLELLIERAAKGEHEAVERHVVFLR